MTVNCSKKSDKDDIGSVGLALTLPGGRNRQHGHLLDHRTTASRRSLARSTSRLLASPQATALVSGLAPGIVLVTMTATAERRPDLYWHDAVHGRRQPDGDGERHPAVQPDPHTTARSPSTAGSTSARTSPALSATALQAHGGRRRSPCVSRRRSSIRATPSPTAGPTARRRSARSLRSTRRAATFTCTAVGHDAAVDRGV